MHSGSVLGDYNLIFDIKSNFTWKTPNVNLADCPQGTYTEDDMTNFMCVKEQTLNRLCNLYPKTKRILQELAIEKRDIIQFFLQKSVKFAEMDVSGIPIGLTRSRSQSGDNREFNNKMMTLRNPSLGSTPNASRDIIEIESSDEDENKLTKKATSIEAAMHEENHKPMTLQEAKDRQIEILNEAGKQKLIELAI